MPVVYDDNCDYVMHLHNHLGRTRQQGVFRWQLDESGRADSKKHYATAILNGQVIGQGDASAKNLAKKYAAFHAMAKLGLL